MPGRSLMICLKSEIELSRVILNGTNNSFFWQFFYTYIWLREPVFELLFSCDFEHAVFWYLCWYAVYVASLFVFVIFFIRSDFCCFCVVMLRLILALRVNVDYLTTIFEDLGVILKIFKLSHVIMIQFCSLRPWSRIGDVSLKCSSLTLISQFFCSRVMVNKG